MSSHGTTVFCNKITENYKITVNNDGANERIKRRQAATEEEKGSPAEEKRRRRQGKEDGSTGEG
jgi:hypothetical protein